MNPYALSPDHMTIINFSGGRSSGFLLWNILKAHDFELPDNMVVIFCNTGKEREETFEFVRLVGNEWDVHINWLEYTYIATAKGGRLQPRHHYRIVEFEDASRHGKPFEELINAKKMLPNMVAMRFCTSELKVKTASRFVRRTLGWKGEFKQVIGIRHDEPKRWGKALFEECDVVMPIAEAGHTIEDVTRFWNP